MHTSRRSSNFDRNVKERSGWLVPAAVIVLTALLCGLFLVYYLAPNPTSFIEEHPAPTAGTDRISLRVGALALAIPANYLVYPKARSGGPRREVAIYAELPDFRGYSDAAADAFAGNSTASPIVYILIREADVDVPEALRLERIYFYDVSDLRGRRGQFGLRAYAFRDNSGYAGQDLFVGRTQGSVVVMRCSRASPDVPSPNCLRDTSLTHGVALSYRFKRAQLANWQKIAAGVAKLVTSFEVAERDHPAS
jgi:hypothetical protein